MTLRRRCFVSGLALLAAGCAAPPAAPSPLLRLAPALLGRELALQQRLVVHAQGRTHRVDVLLEADAAVVRVALIAAGQTAARLVWDGERVEQSRAAWLPAAVSAERVLSDLQLVLWPAQAIAHALPAGWTLELRDGERQLRHGAEIVATVRHASASKAVLEQRRDGYRIEIESHALEDDPS